MTGLIARYGATTLLLLMMVGLRAEPRERPACPDARTAPLGFVLEGAVFRIEVHPHEGEIVRFAEVRLAAPRDPAATATTWRGLVGLGSEIAGVRNELIMDDGYRRLWPIKGGAGHAWSYVMRSNVRVDRPARVSLAVAPAPRATSIGGCAYETWPIERTTVFEDGMRIERSEDFSPELSFFTRVDLKVTQPGKAPLDISYAFDRIYPFPASAPPRRTP